MDKTDPLGLLRSLNIKLEIIHNNCHSDDLSGIVTKLLEDAFEILPHCQKELLLDDDGGIYQRLIINISAAILLHDAEFRSTRLLLKGILQDNDVFVAVLALEVYTLVASNIPPEECQLLLINLLYGVGKISCGFFTRRPEMVHLKCLLQRLFKILPDALKERVIKLFATRRHTQIWRFLGFNSIPLDQVPSILNPVLGITSDCIKSIGQSVSEDVLNIAENISLIATLNNLDVRTDARFSEVVSFIETFWSSDIDREISNNNIIKYFVPKIVAITAISMQSSRLNPHLVFQKLKILLNNKAYSIPIFKMISSMLNVAHLIPIYSTKQNILSEIADILTTALRSNNILMRETYLEMLKHFYLSQISTSCALLFSPGGISLFLYNQLIDYIVYNCKKSVQTPVINDYFNNINKFKHVCLQWNNELSNNNANPPIKRCKFDGDQDKLQLSVPVVKQTAEKIEEHIKRKQNKELVVVLSNYVGV